LLYTKSVTDRKQTAKAFFSEHKNTFKKQLPASGTLTKKRVLNISPKDKKIKAR
jgi:hypothetical protein